MFQTTINIHDFNIPVINYRVCVYIYIHIVGKLLVAPTGSPLNREYILYIYPPVIKRGNLKSTRNGGFQKENHRTKSCILQHAMFKLPEGIGNMDPPVPLPPFTTWMIATYCYLVNIQRSIENDHEF